MKFLARIACAVFFNAGRPLFWLAETIPDGPWWRVSYWLHRAGTWLWSVDFELDRRYGFGQWMPDTSDNSSRSPS